MISFVVDYLDIARRQLPIDEGRRLQAYKDTEGHLTIGIGHNVEDGISNAVCDAIFEEDLNDADHLARSLVPTFDDLTDARKAVLVNMAFNLGPKLAEFAALLRYIAMQDWAAAADAMLDSRWAMQVGLRADRLADAMRAG